MLEDETLQKRKLEEEIALLQSQLLQLSFEADEVCCHLVHKYIYTSNESVPFTRRKRINSNHCNFCTNRSTNSEDVKIQNHQIQNRDVFVIFGSNINKDGESVDNILIESK